MSEKKPLAGDDEEFRARAGPRRIQVRRAGAEPLPRPPAAYEHRAGDGRARLALRRERRRSGRTDADLARDNTRVLRMCDDARHKAWIEALPKGEAIYLVDGDPTRARDGNAYERPSKRKKRA